jgi:DNA (cytosine-5)-methyltransferase 1
MKSVSVVDLFCGIGGLTHGFLKEGFNVVAGIDVDVSCKFAFEKNNAAEFIHKDVETLTAAEVSQVYPKGHTRILVGCAPCAPFSPYTIGKANSKGEKWKLLRSFARLVKEIKPDVVSMENVPTLQSHSVYNEFKVALEAEDYYVKTYLVPCANYGVPQTRKRLELFASKYGEIQILKPTHRPSKHRVVKDVISRLEALEAGERSLSDPLHWARRLSELNLKRIRATPAGGSWADWNEDLVLDCHKTERGQSYRNVYGRMSWDEPSPTITTQCSGLGNGRFGHPEQDRAISLREAALLQTFPRSYKFVPPRTKVNNHIIARHIGNAVPVRLGVIIARSIKKHLENHSEEVN